MPPLRPIQTLTLTLLLGFGQATGSLAQGYSLGEVVDDGPLAQPPVPEVPAGNTGAQVTVTQPPIESLGEPVEDVTAPNLGAPATGAPAGQQALDASMGEPVTPEGGDQLPPPDMGQPADTAPMVFDEFGVTEESTAIPDTPTIPTVTATGIVKSFNESSLNLVMANRTVYRLPADFVDPGLKNGTRVQIEWYADGANRRATAVTIVK